MTEPTATRPDVVVILTDQERAIPSYEGGRVARWREVRGRT